LNLNAKIIPSCAKIDASNYLSRTVANFGSTVSVGYVEAKVYYNGTSNPIYIFTSNDTATNGRNFNLWINAGKPSITIESTVPTVNQSFITTNAISVGWHILKFETTGSAYVVSVDGTPVALTTVAGTNNGLNWIDKVQARDNINIGIQKRATPTTSQEFYCTYVDFNGTNKWYLAGDGSYIYDVIGGAHMTWTGTTHQVYDLGGTTHLLDVGYTKYTKAVSPDEYVPYTTTNTPYDAAAFLTGYTKVADFVGGATIYNGAPSLVDFDYADGANALLGIFKKDDTTIYISTASMIYYDATNKYRWRNDELLNPAIYSDDYKKVGYKGRVMNKTSVSTIAKSISEILAYSEDQIGNKEWSLAKYCTLEDLVVQSGGSPVFDGDNYLTWV
jgi:hypothetical protein